MLDVSGVRDSTGAIVARYIRLRSSSLSEYRVVGVIDSTTATTFEIGNLTVDYSIADIGGIAAGVIVAGKLKINPIGKIRVEANVNFVSVAINSVTVLGNIFHLDDKPCCGIAAVPR